MNVAFLFPGQGSQSPGMLGRLPDHGAVSLVLREAGEVLNLDISKLDSDSSLRSPVSVQLSLLIAGVAAARALLANDVIPMAVAGLSVGAFAAAVACETLRFADALLVVQKRAELMAITFPSGYGMSAVVGLTEKRLGEIVGRIHQHEHPVFLSNINAPNQLVVSGCLESLAKVESIALSSGARKVERLPVNVPSHCPLFNEVASDLRVFLSQMGAKKPIVPYIGNVRARPLRAAELVCDDLASNIASGVRWHDSISVLVELGSATFVEMNPGNVLSRVSAEFFPQQRFISVEDSSLKYIRNHAQHKKN